MSGVVLIAVNSIRETQEIIFATIPNERMAGEIKAPQNVSLAEDDDRPQCKSRRINQIKLENHKIAYSLK